MTVFKYVLPIEDNPTISMPQGAQLLHVADQYGALCVWALVNPEAPPMHRRFRVAGTGHPEAVGVYVGTALMLGGLVFHVFDRGEAS